MRAELYKNNGELLATGGVLADRSIARLVEREMLGIKPFDPKRVQPSSYDVTLDNEFRIFNNHGFVCIDPKEPMDALTTTKRVPDKPQGTSGSPIPNYLVLHPGEFVLGQTVERLVLPDNIVCRIEGKSSLGRIGLLVHATAGFVDPGFQGRLTLELSNQAMVPIKLYPGMPIGQFSFQWTDQPVEHPYDGKYQGDESPTASRIHQDFEEAR
jgi:dCTP deaminase